MLELPAIILVFVSIFGFLNHKYLKLPLTVGLVLIALISGLGVLLIEAVVPSLKMSDTIKNWLDAIDFNRTLMNGMLSFLLFAGALHVDLNNLMKAKWREKDLICENRSQERKRVLVERYALRM